MKILVPLAIAGVAIWFFGTHAMSSAKEGATESAGSITDVGDLLERAASGKPLDGRPAPDARWVRRMTAACVQRERLLAAVPRVASPGGITDRASRILAVHRAYAVRVASLRAPKAWEPEARQIRGFNAEQQRILRRLVAVARSGNLGAASRQAVSLRDLAGRANPVFLRVGLPQCAFTGSGMPL